VPIETYDVDPNVIFSSSRSFDTACAVHFVLTQVEDPEAEAWLKSVESGVLESIRNGPLASLPLRGLELLALAISTTGTHQPSWNASYQELSGHLDATDEKTALYHLLERVIPLASLREMDAEAVIDRLAEEAPWVMKGDADSIRFVVKHCGSILRAAAEAYRGIGPAVEDKRAEFEDLYGESCRALEEQYQSLNSDPIQLIIEIMKKRPVRLYDFRAYYFIPSWFVIPYRVRVWDEDRHFVVMPPLPLSVENREVARLEEYFKSLADRSRLLTLRELTFRRSYGRELAQILGLTPPTVSHHLAILREAGLVQEQVSGNTKYFRTDIDRIDEFTERLKRFLLGSPGVAAGERGD